MGLRGPGAARLRAAREQVEEKPKRRLPWQRKGLDRAGRVIAFLEFLPVTKGILAGKRMKLLPDQREFIEETYGRRTKDGRRAISLAIKSAPKGNGKTGLVAGLGLCHLLGPEAEERGEVYSAAIDRQQAGIMFAEMEAIILRVPEFAARVNIQRFQKKIEVLDGDGAGSVYEALSADARRAHGLAPSLWVYDELAQAKDRTLLDNLMEGMGKRRETLGVVISTQAASDDHPLSELIDDGLSGMDPSVYVQLICVPPDADIFDDEELKKANPAWGRYLDVNDLLRSKERARRMPGFEPAFRNLRGNQRVDTATENRIVTLPVWKLGDVRVDLEELEGRRCYGGLDLSVKHDLTALVLVFPDDEPDPSYDIVPFFWTPKGQLEGRRPAEKELFERWIKGEFLTPIEGPIIRSAVIARKLGELSKRFDIRAIGYDRWRIDDLKADLDQEGIEVPLEPFGQGFKDMAPAIDFFAELALTSRLRHGGHPVLTANVANAIVISDPAGNQKIDKQKSNRRASSRIDGAVSMAMALGTARRFVEDDGARHLDDFLANPVMVGV